MLKYTDEDLRNIIDNEKNSRESVTAKWLELWSLYKTRPIKVAEDDGWKSKLNDGRIFELIETVASYIRNALFFSDRWATIESNEPGLAEVVPLVSYYFANALNNSNFKREFRVFLCQLLLTGFSSIVSYWDDKQDTVAFQCVNSYDMHIDSSQRYNENSSYSFRDVQLSYSDFCDWVDGGLIDVNDKDEAWEEYANSQTIRDAELYNLRDTIPVTNREYIICTEYYCPHASTLYRLIDTDIVKETQVDECPWTIGLLFETPEEAYPLSLVDSSIGLILANNILHNKRLDNIALSVDNMWLFVDDGVTNPRDIKNEPGKVITVARPDVLMPLPPPSNNFTITYQEQQVLDGKIDRNIGTGAMISANSYRQGERVTKAEIDSVKDAGGNRLTDIYEHIESTVIIPLLKRALKLIRDNTQKPKVVKLASDVPDVYDYYRLLPSNLKHDFSVKLTGTQSVINRDRNISLLSEFLTLVASVPQFQEFVDYKNLYFDLLVKFGFDDPQRYMLAPAPEEEQVPATPQSPLQQMSTEASVIGGQPMADALQQQTMLGNAPNLAASMSGYSPQTIDDTTEQEQLAATAALSTPPSI